LKQHAVLTAIGDDRLGLVEEVSELISARGGSIEESRMANLHGQFAIAMLVTGTAQVIESIGAGLDVLISRAAIQAQLTRAKREPSQTARRTRYRLTGRALDQIGLVHKVARVLSGLDVNIESMETALDAAPFTGTPMFRMDLMIGVPDTTLLSALRGEVGDVCSQFDIDWQLAELGHDVEDSPGVTREPSTLLFPGHGWGRSRIARR
jgi:glycine cleavage system transcriptional repressor